MHVFNTPIAGYLLVANPLAIQIPSGNNRPEVNYNQASNASSHGCIVCWIESEDGERGPCVGQRSGQGGGTMEMYVAALTKYNNYPK
jgi:hypothetical protein